MHSSHHSHHSLTDNTTGEVHEGLVECVQDIVDFGNPNIVNSLAEMEAWGTVDPVPYEYGYDVAGDDGGVPIRKQPERFLELISRVNVAEPGWLLAMFCLLAYCALQCFDAYCVHACSF